MDDAERTAFIAEAVRIYTWETEETYAQWLMDNMLTMTHKDLAIIAGRALAMYADGKSTW